MRAIIANCPFCNLPKFNLSAISFIATILNQSLYIFYWQLLLIKIISILLRIHPLLSIHRIYTEEQPGDAAIMLFMKNLQERDSGTYTCEGVYANNEKMVTQVSISTFSEFACISHYILEI